MAVSTCMSCRDISDDETTCTFENVNVNELNELNELD